MADFSDWSKKNSPEKTESNKSDDKNANSDTNDKAKHSTENDDLWDIEDKSSNQID